MAARALCFAAGKVRMAAAAPRPRVAPFAPSVERRGPLAPALAGAPPPEVAPLPSCLLAPLSAGGGGKGAALTILGAAGGVSGVGAFAKARGVSPTCDSIGHVDDALAEILDIKKTLGEAAAVRVAPLAPAMGQRSLFAAAPALAEPHETRLLPPLPRHLLAPCSAAGKGGIFTGLLAGGEGAGLVAALAGAAPVRAAWRPMNHHNRLLFAAAGFGMARRGYAAGSGTDDENRDSNTNVPKGADAGGDHATVAFGAGPSKRTGPRGRAYRIRKRLLRPSDRKRDSEIHDLKRIVIRLSKAVSTLANVSVTFRTEVAVNSKSLLRHVLILPYTVTVVLIVSLSCGSYFVITEVLPSVLVGVSDEVSNLVVEYIEELKKAGMDDEKIKPVVEIVTKEFKAALKQAIKDAFKFWRWFS